MDKTFLETVSYVQCECGEKIQALIHIDVYRNEYGELVEDHYVWDEAETYQLLYKHNAKCKYHEEDTL